MQLHYIPTFLLFLFLSQFANAQSTIILNEEFEDNNNQWRTEKTKGLSAELKNGLYLVNNNSDSVFRTAFLIPNLDPNKEDFSIELKLRQVSGKKTNPFGLVFSLSKDENRYKQFLISADGQCYIDDFNAGRSTVLMDSILQIGLEKGFKANVLRIEKRANILSYYINGKVVLKSGQNDLFGPKIELVVGPNTKIEFDYLRCYKHPKSLNVVAKSDIAGSKKKLDFNINSDYPEISPVVAADGNTMYFVRGGSTKNVGYTKNPRDQDIWYSIKNTKGEWTRAFNMGRPLNNEAPNAVISISPDHNAMIVLHNYYEDGSPKGNGLSITKRGKKNWGIPKTIEIVDYQNKSLYNDFFVCSDNKTLLLAVEAAESFGDRDIYVSFLQDDGKWSRPKNIGNVVNSFGGEGSPFMASDNKTLYFSSDGHQGYGNHDLFVTKRLDDSWTNWSVPQNLGPQINSISWEFSLFADARGDYVYLGVNGDIYTIENPQRPEPVVLIKGKVLNKKTNEPMSVKISYYDLATNKELGTAESNPETGEYTIVLPAGKKYSYRAEEKGFYAVSNFIDLLELKIYTEKTVDLYLVPFEKGENFRLNNIFFDYSKATLQPESYPELDRLFDLLSKNSKLNIEIGGHTDDDGAADYNLTLSQQRAEAVVQYLVAKGLPASRFKAVGYGKNKPLVPNDSPENRAQNRRVEFTIL